MKRTATMAAFFVACFSSAGISQQHQVQDGCEAVATIHRESCMVSHYVQCGDRTEVHGYENGKLVDSHFFGPDWDILGYQADGGRSDVQATEGSAPEASLKQALETGESIGAREMTFSTGVLKGNAVDLASELRMSDEEVQISGETLRVGTLVRTMTVRKNGVSSNWDFQVFAADDASLFIEGEVEITQFGDVQTLAWTPTKIIRPGQPGFMSITPPAGCGG